MTREIAPMPEPFDLFGEWITKATNAKIEEPTAMAVATATASGVPSCRMILLKAWDTRGFVFYTNLDSRKAHEIQENPNVSLCFHWKELKRQIRIEGVAAPVSADEADAYFKSRPLQSRIGAWASKQSHEMKDPFELERRVVQTGLKFGTSAPGRPEFWSGFRVAAIAMEFWQDRNFRLHERVKYTRQSPDGDWEKCRLFP